MRKMEKSAKNYIYLYIILEKSRLSALWHTDELQIELRFKVSFTEDPSFPPYVLLFFHKEILYFQEPSLQNTSCYYIIITYNLNSGAKSYINDESSD